MKHSIGAVLICFSIASGLTASAAPPPKALLFDVMGTCVQVTSSLLAEGKSWGKTNHVKGQWSAFTDAWVNDHIDAIDQIVSGAIPWMSTDAIHRRDLPSLIEQYLKPSRPLSQSDLDAIDQFWDHLNPWPDTDQALAALHRQFELAAFTNADTGQIEAMSGFAGLPWDVTISSDEVQLYKPEPGFYLYAEKKIGLAPQDILLVAAHPYDLRAAKALGWRTAFVKRPGEYDPSDAANASAEFDFVAKDFLDLANELAAATAHPQASR